MTQSTFTTNETTWYPPRYLTWYLVRSQAFGPAWVSAESGKHQVSPAGALQGSIPGSNFTSSQTQRMIAMST
ncbi:hypothetical protein SynA1524_01938 [Synechococcus sp. A15-24]|nr:hypothetical protein SynA1524_01938 [Synechococcus sp. A15-24]